MPNQRKRKPISRPRKVGGRSNNVRGPRIKRKKVPPNSSVGTSAAITSIATSLAKEKVLNRQAQGFLLTRAAPWLPFLNGGVQKNIVADSSPSFAHRHFSRHSISFANRIGLGNDVFFAVNPYSTAVADVPCWWMADNATYQTPFDAVDSGRPIAEYAGNGLASTAPFRLGDIQQSKVTAKLVSCGIKFIDLTPTLYRGGGVYGFTNGNNQPVFSRLFDTILSDKNSLFERLSGKELCWIYNSKNTDLDDTFIDASNYTEGMDSKQHVGGLLFRGVPPEFVGQIELWSIVEYSIQDGPLAGTQTSSPLHNEQGKKVISVIDAARQRSMEPERILAHAKSGAVHLLVDSATAAQKVETQSHEHAARTADKFSLLEKVAAGAAGVGNILSQISEVSGPIMSAVEGIGAFLG